MISSGSEGLRGIPQPWRGLFGVAVTVGYTFLITAIFDLSTFNGYLTLLLMCFVPILVMVGIGWQRGTYPPTEGLLQPWKGMLLTCFVVMIGTIASFVILTFISGGVAQPFSNIYAHHRGHHDIFPGNRLWPVALQQTGFRTGRMDVPGSGVCFDVCIVSGPV